MNLQVAQAALKEYFGYEQFRPMQAEIIEAIYQKKDVLVLMPTGGGKSVCFQIPAVTQKGVCIVVSPLIALMKDQVEALTANGIDAAFLNSSLSASEQHKVEDDVLQGKVKLLYVSPEKLVSQNFQPFLKRLKINLFAIDEAHCISAWGHDFRPEYTQLRFIKREYSDIPIVALTATADKLTRKDIIQQLSLHEPEVFVASFDRPNLSLSVRPALNRMKQIVDFLRSRPNQSGIIYCLSRNSTEKVAESLLKHGIKAAYYHAMLNPKDRSEIQEMFINDKVQVVCATIAFGMGIDKSNVRWVIHYNLPKNIESYYQEIGRSGRDGAKADTVLFYSFADVSILRDIIYSEEERNTQLNKDILKANQELQIAKLERMMQYAEAQICRRRILLNYFGETLEKDCGNCDVCQNPPQYIDGTVNAQKALSALVRMEEKVGMNMLIDVLRGSARQEIMQNGYQNIKTYGAGRDIPYGEWQHFITQFLNQGLLEIAYDQKQSLKLTPLAKDVLFNGKKVQLTRLVSDKEEKERKRKEVETKPLKELIKDELFERLRVLRAEIAKDRGLPPYVVFSDASLQELATKRPMTDADFEEISGVGLRKLQLYGTPFMEAIKAYVKEKVTDGSKMQGATYMLTHELYLQGKTIEEIAAERNLNPVTIYSHLAYLYEKKENIDLTHFINKKELEIVQNVLKTQSEPFELKTIFTILKEEIPYFKIRFAIAHWNREKQG